MAIRKEESARLAPVLPFCWTLTRQHVTDSKYCQLSHLMKEWYSLQAFFKRNPRLEFYSDKSLFPFSFGQMLHRMPFKFAFILNLLLLPSFATFAHRIFWSYPINYSMTCLLKGNLFRINKSISDYHLNNRLFDIL